MTERLFNPVIVGAAAFALVAAAASAETLYVDDDTSPGGDGLTWDTAYRFLQDALDAAAASGGAITEIRVAGGTYTPDRDEAHPDVPIDSSCCYDHCYSWGCYGDCDDSACRDTVCLADPTCCTDGWDQMCADLAQSMCGICPDREATFQLLNGVMLLGGFAGSAAADPDERDVELYESILSGDLAHNGEPSFNGGIGTDDSYNVVTASGTDATAIIDGFTISGGSATENYVYGQLTPHDYGGGMYIEGGSPIVANCTFRNNAAWGGAGIYNLNGSPTVLSCTFQDNWALEGGGLFNEGGSPDVVHCLFVDNIASNGCSGGCEGGSGGGMLNIGGSATILGCTFAGNHSVLGGGMHNALGDPVVVNCLFVGNDVGSDVEGYGAGLFNLEGSPAVSNCTFVKNLRCWGGGHGPGCGWSGIANDQWAPGSPVIMNCIFNDSGVYDEAGLAIVSYSCLEGGWPGHGGNIDADPLFAVGSAGTWTADSTYDPQSRLTTYTDATASFPAGELVGQFVELELNQFIVVSELIVANTSTTICVLGWVEADAGDSYETVSYHLTPGSPCIDAGHNNAIADLADVDLDGNPRFANDPDTDNTGCGVPVVVDMGAYEFQGKPATAKLGDLDGDGAVSVVDLLALLAAWGPAADDCVLADLDLNGTVDGGDVQALLDNWG